MTIDKPLVSIITACRNSARFLENAIQSVLNQSYQHIEYIIIDGSSTDNTIDIIKKYQDKLAYWISEPDRCYAEAWNKGLAKANGEIIGLLNADDLYDNNAVEHVIRHLGPADHAITYGVTKFFDAAITDSAETSNTPFRTDKLHLGFGFYHTTCFVPKRIYNDTGFFDTSYSIAADTDFLLRCHLRGVEFRQLDNVTFMRRGGLSKNHELAGRMQYYSQLWKYGFSKNAIIFTALGYLRYRLRRLIRSTASH